MSSDSTPAISQPIHLRGVDLTSDDMPEPTPEQMERAVEQVELALRPLAERRLERALDEWSLALRQSSPEVAKAEQALLEDLYGQCGDPETSDEMYAVAEIVDHRRKIMVERNKAEWRRKRNRRKRGRRR